MNTWVDDHNVALLTDLYELTMAAAYLADGLEAEATFELWVRSLPETRNFLVVAGLDGALRYLETLRFEAAALDYLRSLDRFSPAFLDHLAGMRFRGEVWAMPEGTVAFAAEPLLRVTAPLIQAQIVETFLLNAVGFQTMIASKAARIHLAGRGRPFVDFGARRAHGADAALKAARAAFVGGAAATSLVLAGSRYGIPVTGTMAHSYVLAHHDEAAAFEAFARSYAGEGLVLLIDTFDTVGGAEIAVEVARRLRPEGVEVAAVRLDSGDLADLSVEVRTVLDRAGLEDVQIVASGGLDEHRIAALVEAGAPIDGFGVGTRLTTSEDAPNLDVVYKLVEDHTGPLMKTSTGKVTLPGAKQVLRGPDGDLLALADEEAPGHTPLLEPVMEGGERTGPAPDLEQIRSRAVAAVEALPEPLRRLDGPAHPPWPVTTTPRLRELTDSLLGDKGPQNG